MKKKLKLSKNEWCEMSFEETLQKYDKLLKKRANSYIKFYEFEDMLQLARIGLWRAYETYRDNGVAFGYYANIIITNELNKHHQLNKARYKRKTCKIKEVVSLNYNIAKGADRVVEKIDLLVDDTDFTEEIIDRQMVETAYKRLKVLKPRDYHIVTTYLDGSTTQKQLADRYGVSQKRIYRIYHRALKNLRKYFEDKLGA